MMGDQEALAIIKTIFGLLPTDSNAVLIDKIYKLQESK